MQKDDINTTSKPILLAKNLSRNFGNKKALDSLNLTVNSGEIHCLLGANGAGKTTTINLFLGFISATSGSAFVDGEDVASNLFSIRSKLAYVPEQVNLYPTLTGLENLTYFANIAGHKASETQKLEYYFDQVGLQQQAVNNRVESYSKGMRQKVGLAIALAKGAKALLLDEPLSGLDPMAANEFCLRLSQLASQGTAVLMATHDLFRAKELAETIGIMKSGKLVANLNTKDLNHNQLETIYLKHMREQELQTGVAQ